MVEKRKRHGRMQKALGVLILPCSDVSKAGFLFDQTLEGGIVEEIHKFQVACCSFFISWVFLKGLFQESHHFVVAIGTGGDDGFEIVGGGIGT